MCIAWPTYGPIVLVGVAFACLVVSLAAFQWSQRRRARQLAAELAVARSPFNYRWTFSNVGPVLTDRVSGKVVQTVSWQSFERVVVRPGTIVPEHVSFDISVEFDSPIIEWEVEGSEQFLESMAHHVPGFDLSAAQKAVGRAIRQMQPEDLYVNQPDA